MSFTSAKVVASTGQLSASASLIPTASTFTIALWFKADALVNNAPIWQKGTYGKDFTFEMDGSGNIIFYAENSGSVTLGTITVGTWHHYAVTWVYGGSGVLVSTTGYLDAVGTAQGSWGPTNSTLFTLGYDPNYGRFTTGRYCETAIWQGTALTGAQITSLYNLGVSGLSIDHFTGPAPTTYWKYDALIGGQFADKFGVYPLTASGVTLIKDSVVTHGEPFSGIAQGVSPTMVSIIFSESYDPTTGLNPANYTLSGGATATAVVPGATNQVFVTVSTLLVGKNYAITPTGVLSGISETWAGGALNFNVVPRPYGFIFDPAKHAALLVPEQRKLTSDGLVDIGGVYNCSTSQAIQIRRGTTGATAYVGLNSDADVFTTPCDAYLLNSVTGEMAVSMQVEWQATTTSTGYNFVFVITDTNEIYPMALFWQGGGVSGFFGTLYVRWNGSTLTQFATSVAIPAFVPVVVTVVRKMDPVNTGRWMVLIYMGANPTPVAIYSNLAPPLGTYASGPVAAMTIGGDPFTNQASHAYIGEVLIWKVAPTGAQVAAACATAVPSCGWDSEGTGLPIGRGGFSIGMKFGAIDGFSGTALILEGQLPGTPESNANPVLPNVLFSGTQAHVTNCYASGSGLSGKRFSGVGTDYYETSVNISVATFNAVLGSQHTWDVAIRLPALPSASIQPVSFRDNPGAPAVQYYMNISPAGDISIHTINNGTDTSVLTLTGIFAGPTPNLKHIKIVYDPISQTLTGYVGDLDQHPGIAPVQIAQATGVILPFAVQQTAGNSLSAFGFYPAPAIGSLVFGGGLSSNLPEVPVEIYSPTLRPDIWLDAYSVSSGAAPGPTLPPSGGTIAPTYLTLTIPVVNGPVALGGNSAIPGDWLIQGSDSSVVAVTAVNISGTNLVLTTGDMKIGLTYTLTVPSGIIGSSSGLFYTGPYTYTYTGASLAPTVSGLLASPDDQTLQVTFNKPMNQVTALNINNYVISGGVQVIGVTPIGPAIFKLKTLGEQPGVTYTLTPSSNIKDLVGNSLT